MPCYPSKVSPDHHDLLPTEGYSCSTDPPLMLANPRQVLLAQQACQHAQGPPKGTRACAAR